MVRPDGNAPDRVVTGRRSTPTATQMAPMASGNAVMRPAKAIDKIRTILEPGARNDTFYVARIAKLGSADFVKIDGAGCHHAALLTPDPLAAARAPLSG